MLPTARVRSADALRGLTMILMALDRTRDSSIRASFQPRMRPKNGSFNTPCWRA
jgi:uncharacterized membrane protein